MKVLRTLRAARGVVMALLVFALGLLPPLRTTCACAAKADSAAACCAVPETTASCCCSTGGCTLHPVKVSCCSQDGEGCDCAADPLPPEPRQVPAEKSAAPEVDAAVSQPLVWQLPAVIPVLAAGCEAPRFGPPAVGPSLQIAFCVWRN